MGGTRIAGQGRVEVRAAVGGGGLERGLKIDSRKTFEAAPKVAAVGGHRNFRAFSEGTKGVIGEVWVFLIKQGEAAVSGFGKGPSGCARKDLGTVVLEPGDQLATTGR